MSGFDKDGFFETVASELRNAIHNFGSLVFLASDPEGFTKSDDYAERIFGWFHQANLSFSTYNVIDKRVDIGIQRSRIRKASCVFLMGGKTKKQMQYITEQELIPIIKNYNGVIMGLSAGAINMSIRSIIANPLHPPTSTHSGIGLVQTTVIPHYELISDRFMQSDIIPLASKEPIYCLCDDAVIVTKNNSVRHNGTIHQVIGETVKLLSDDDLI